jgi:hypothetical protein
VITLLELQHLATRLTGAVFVRQVGPFVLLQHEPGSPLLGGDENRRTAHVSKGAMVKKSVQIKSDFGKLSVAQLPPMAEEGLLRVGRAPDNDLILDDPSASKYHAAIKWVAGHAELGDLESRNGTALNGELLTPNTLVPLRDGQVISFGGIQFVYYTSPRIFDILASTKLAP